MLVLTLRTDKPQAEIGLYEDMDRVEYFEWEAHRRLAETIHTKIDDVLQAQGKGLADIEAILIYKGPGSFTGLRIGMSVANALAHSLGIPILSVGGDDWLGVGLKKLSAGISEEIALPTYGSPVNITQPKK